MGETWKIIPGFERYEASDDGRVRRADTKRERTLRTTEAGYVVAGELIPGPPALPVRGVRSKLTVCRVITAASLDDHWSGFIWMNPPFGARNGVVPWLQKFTEHGNGIALVPDRTSAPWWQDFAPQMDAILFVSSKLKFLDKNWRPGESPAQGTTLMALGAQALDALSTAQQRGLGFIPSQSQSEQDAAQEQSK